MRKYLTALAAMLLIVGCASFQTNAGKTLASSALLVDSGMKGWAVWVVQGQATADQEADVRAAYGKYQASMMVATNAYLTLSLSGDKEAWQQAEAVLTANRIALLLLINQFQTSTTK